MPLVSPYTMLKDAQKTEKAVGAFNIENMEMARAVIDAATEANLSVILQTTPSTVRYAPPAVFSAMVSALAKDAPVPIAMHLDHGSSFGLAMEAIKAGYTSVMFDGSQLSFDENVRQTKQVVNAAGNIPVEAELGSVGGKEDDHEAANAYTDPQDAEKFVASTGVGSLAIAIGTAHGIYSGTPVLDIQRLIEIRKRIDVPLVLHGASGLSAEAVRACIKEGICKVNFATELRIAYSDGVKTYLRENPGAFDPKTYGKAGYDYVKKLTLEKLEVCNV
ncbi:MAG: class II fructose-bisphosphate aldolase family protein [Firmicutes bacterium]|nr:class II fructose-bisphosphate aldolase family protein [Bacillota bacterium]